MFLFLILLVTILLFYFFEIFRKNKIIKVVSPIFSILLFYLLLYNVTYNSDWDGYQFFYEGASSGDILFDFLSPIFNNHGYEYRNLYQFYIILMGISFTYFASRFSLNNTFVIIIIYLVFMIVPLSNQISYYVAFALFLISTYQLIVLKNKIAFIVFCFISVISHNGIIPLYLFIAFFYLIKEKRILNVSIWSSIALLGLTLLLFLLVPTFFGRFIGYFEENRRSSILGGLYSNLIWIIWIFLIYKRHKNLKKLYPEQLTVDVKYNYLYKLSLFPIMFIPIGFLLKIISSRYILAIIIVLLAYAFYSLKYTNKIKTRANLISSILVMVVITYLYIYILPFYIHESSETYLKTLEILQSNSSLSFLWEKFYL